MHTLYSSVRQAVTTHAFFVAALGAAAMLLLTSVEGMLMGFRAEVLLAFGYHNELIERALSSNAMTLALPVLAALPYTAAVVDDVKSGFIKAYLPRTNVMRYLIGKVTACAVSGGLCILIGTAIAWGILALAFLPLEAPPAVVDKAGEAIRYVSPIWGKLLLCFASGALWAAVGMLAANLTGSKYMAYATPFVVYYVLVILYERYFYSLYVLYPKEWLTPSSLWLYGNAGVLILVTELALIASLGAGWAAKRMVSRI